MARPDRTTRRRLGKADAIEAEALPSVDRRHGNSDAMRKCAKDSATDGRTKAIIQIKAILVAAPTALRERPEPLHYGALIELLSPAHGQAINP